MGVRGKEYGICMSWWSDLKKRWGRKAPPLPIIMTQWGPTTEGARKQAALNLRDDPEKRAKVEEMVGVEEARRRYPEAYS
jgi:hypothetical protein